MPSNRHYIPPYPTTQEGILIARANKQLCILWCSIICKVAFHGLATRPGHVFYIGSSAVGGRSVLPCQCFCYCVCLSGQQSSVPCRGYSPTPGTTMGYLIKTKRNMVVHGSGSSVIPRSIKRHMLDYLLVTVSVCYPSTVCALACHRYNRLCRIVVHNLSIYLSFYYRRSTREIDRCMETFPRFPPIRNEILLSTISQ